LDEHQPAQEHIDLEIDLDHFLAKLRELGLFIQDRKNHRVYPNKYWYRWGYDENDMIDGKFTERVHPDDLPRIQTALRNLEDVRDADTDVMFRLRTSEGDWRWIFSTSIAVSRNEAGEIDNYIGFDFDMTEHMLARQRAERLAREASTLASATAILNARLDLRHTIDAILEQAGEVIPFSSASVQRFNGDHLEIIGGRGFESMMRLIGVKFPVPSDNPNTEIVATRKPLVINSDVARRYPGFGEVLQSDIMCWAGFPLIHAGDLIGVMTFDRIDGPVFTEEEVRLGSNFANHVAMALNNALLYEETRQVSIKDHLTGAYNRRWMYEQLQREMELSRRHGHDLSILLTDLDDFKEVNDNYGHLFGDRVLKEMTEEFLTQLRNTDYLCRYGGEEFVAILPHSSEEQAYEIGERIRTAFMNRRWPEDVTRRITVSIGCAAMTPSDARNPDGLIGRADRALYFSKQNGKNLCMRYSNLG
jgi:diguanylate cyclase (GGDEF)-like protein